jgi:HTTM domain
MSAAPKNTAPWSLKSALPALARGWNEFFHQPCDGRVCAAVRIAYATLVLIHLAVLYPDLDYFFSDRGVLPLEKAPELVSPYAWSLLARLPSTSPTVHVCFWIAVAHAVAVLVGAWPRMNALFLFLWIVSFQNRNNMINDGQDTVMRLIGFFMIWLPSGQCWSVNALVRRWLHQPEAQARGPAAVDLTTPEHSRHVACAVPGWGLRLLQIQMAAILLSTGLVKLSGDSWLNGTALYYVSRLDDHFGRFTTPAWVFDSPWIVALMTWGVLVVELAAPLLIWFRETRRACLAALVAFHLANEWTMNLFLFHWLMLCGWMAFLSPDDFRWLWRRRDGVKSADARNIAPRDTRRPEAVSHEVRA